MTDFFIFFAFYVFLFWELFHASRDSSAMRYALVSWRASVSWRISVSRRTHFGYALLLRQRANPPVSLSFRIEQKESLFSLLPNLYIKNAFFALLSGNGFCLLRGACISDVSYTQDSEPILLSVFPFDRKSDV